MCLTTLRRALQATGLVLVLLASSVFLPGTALAHEGEESEASQTVLQAIALIVSSPGDMHVIEDKVGDALAAVREGESDELSVDPDLLVRAGAALEAGDMSRARVLLQRSLGARVDLQGTDVQPILHLPDADLPAAPAKAAATGTSVVTDQLPGRGALNGADYTLLAVAVALAALGIWVSVRTRPVHSVHQLRQGGPGRKEAS